MPFVLQSIVNASIYLEAQNSAWKGVCVIASAKYQLGDAVPRIWTYMIALKVNFASFKTQTDYWAVHIWIEISKSMYAETMKMVQVQKTTNKKLS